MISPDDNIGKSPAANSRGTEKQFANLLMQSPFAFAILQGREMVVLIANNAIKEVWGKGDQLEGKSLFDIMPEIKGQGFADLLYGVFDTGEPFLGYEMPVHLVRNGIDEEVYFNFVYQPFREEDQTITGVTIIANEVTPQAIANKRIKASEENVRNLLLQAPVGIAMYRGEEMEIELVNDIMLQYWGVSRQEAAGKRLWELLPEIAAQGLSQITTEVFRTGKNYVSPETPIAVVRNGEPLRVYARFVFQARTDINGKVIGLFGIADDITDQVLSRQKVEASEKALNELANAMPQLVWIADQNGNVTYYNDRISEFAGATRDAEGKWHWGGLVHQDDIAQTTLAWAAALEGGDTYQAEHRIQMKDGSYRWFLSRGHPYKSEDGLILKWYGTATDIHTQKTIAERLENLVDKRTGELEELNHTLQEKNIHLENAQNFLQQLINSSIELISVLDRDLKYITVNKKFEEVINVSHDSIIGKSLFDVMPKVQNTIQHEYTLRALRGEKAYLDKRQSVARPDLVFDTYYIPLIVQQKVEGVIIMSRDVTDIVKSEVLLESMNLELLRSNDDLQQFAHVASHDLKEPVRKVNTFMSRLEYEMKEHLNEKARNYIQKIQSATARMTQMIEGVLAYSTLGASIQKTEQVNLNTVIKNIEADLEVMIHEKNGSVTHDDLPSIEGSSLLLHQLFYNLIVNALKFSHQGKPPEIIVSSTIIEEAATSYAEIRVSDNGIGFDKARADMIFHPFSRLNSKDQYEGTGLGLALCKKIVERHKGSITADGEKNKGATFTIKLPLQQLTEMV